MYPQFHKHWRWSIPAAIAFYCAGAVADDARSPINVDWADPSTFAEVRHNACRNRIKPEEWLGELAQYVQRRGSKVLGPGQHLDVTITDIQRAGACEPWRGPRWDDVRVVKDIYAPRIDLHYTLTASDGSLVRKGEGALRDGAFLSRSSIDRDDPLRYEKRMLDDWLRHEFAPH